MDAVGDAQAGVVARVQASTATRSRTTLLTTVRLIVGLVGHRSVSVAQHARRERLIPRLAQQQEGALGGHRLEREVGDAGKHVLDRLHRHERLRDVAEESQDAAPAAVASRPSLARGATL